VGYFKEPDCRGDIKAVGAINAVTAIGAGISIKK